MKLLNRYVLRQWLLSFLGSHLILTCLLLLEDAYKNFYFFIKSKMPIWEIAKYCVILSASFIPLIIPVTIFVATLFTLGQLHKKNEITAMRCAGMNIIEIVKPLIFCGIILSLFNVAFEAFVAPRTLEYTAFVRMNTNRKLGRQTSVNKLGFYNHVNDRIWFLKKLDKLSYEASNITINCYDDQGNEKKRIFAESASFSDQTNSWTLKYGTVSSFEKKSDLPKQIEPFISKKFPNLTEHPKDMLATAKNLEDLSFYEVLNAIKYAKNTKQSKIFEVKFHKIFANAAGCFVILVLAIPFALVGIRVNPFVNMAKAISFLLFFFILGAAFSILGKSGTLAPILAAWIPNFLILISVGISFKKAI